MCLMCACVLYPAYLNLIGFATIYMDFIDRLHDDLHQAVHPVVCKLWRHCFHKSSYRHFLSSTESYALIREKYSGTFTVHKIESWVGFFRGVLMYYAEYYQWSVETENISIPVINKDLHDDNNQILDRILFLFSVPRGGIFLPVSRSRLVPVFWGVFFLCVFFCFLHFLLCFICWLINTKSLINKEYMVIMWFPKI